MNNPPLDVSQAPGLFWATVFGAALGVVAGTVIQYILALFAERKSKNRQRNALVKELIYNRSLVDELQSEMVRFRNAVNGDVLGKYYGFFSFEKAIFAQANACASNGMLYEFFSADEIRSAQRIVSTLSLNHSNWVNGEITRRREIVQNTPEKFDKGEVVRFVDFTENNLKDLAAWIDELKTKLQPT